MGVRMIRVNNARENILTALQEFCISNGICIQLSQAYAPESSGRAESLLQEHLKKARIIMLAISLPHELCDEGLCHANWMGNRPPSSLINFSIPVQKWNQNDRI